MTLRRFAQTLLRLRSSLLAFAALAGCSSYPPDSEIATHHLTAATTNAPFVDVTYAGRALFTHYSAGSTATSSQFHSVTFHFTRAADDRFEPDFSATGYYPGAPPYRIFFLRHQPIEGGFLFEVWGNLSDSGPPVKKLGTARFVGTPGHWSSYLYDQGVYVLASNDAFVEGGSTFSIAPDGREVMIEDDRYVSSNDGTLVKDKTARLYRQP
jgi:hypothetical protein